MKNNVPAVKPAYTEDDFFDKRPERIFELVKILAPILNEIHDVQHSEKFWLRLLALQLKSWIGQKNFLTRQEIFIYRPFTTINSFNPISLKQTIDNWFRYIGKAIFDSKRLKVLNKELSENMKLCFGPRAERIAKHIDGYNIKQCFPFWMLFRPNISARKIWKSKIDEQQDVVIKNILRSIPAVYIEYFKALYDSVLVVKPQEKSFHYEHIGSVLAQFIIAKYQEAGAFVTAYQTGGYMGEIANHPDKVFYEVVDELRTYGWKQHKKDTPGKAFRLEEFSELWQRSKKDVDEFNEIFDIAIVYTSVSDKTRHHLKNFTNIFLNKIDRGKYPNVILRPRPVFKFIARTEGLHDLGVKLDKIRVDDSKKPLAILVSKSRIVVQTNLPSTNFLECLAVDHPVLAINTNDRASDLFKNKIVNLYRLNIVHDSVEDLVTFLNSMDELETWWDSVIESKEYNEFKAMFCGTCEM